MFHLNDIGHQVGQGLVDFDLLCVLLDLVLHGLQLVSHSQHLALHDLTEMAEKRGLDCLGLTTSMLN